MRRIKPKKRSLRAAKENRAAHLFLIPAFVGLAVLTYGPLLAVFGLSFFGWRGVGAPSFAGLENYARLFTEDPYFYNSIRVTIYFSVMAVLGSLVYSLVVAMLLNRRVPARGFFRALFYLPYILPGTAVYIGWSLLYETNFGLFNNILNMVGINDVRFLADRRMVAPSLAFIAVWLAGNLIVIFLAGLQNVPRVYHEAAEIDGANAMHRFFNITVPCMTPIIFYNLLMSLITNMQVVTPALALTSGGPSGGSMFLTYLMYREGFKMSQLGYASAISFIIFILIGLFTVLVFATSKSWIFYEGGDD